MNSDKEIGFDKYQKVEEKKNKEEEGRMMIVGMYLSGKMDGSTTRECNLNFTVQEKEKKN